VHAALHPRRYRNAGSQLKLEFWGSKATHFIRWDFPIPNNNWDDLPFREQIKTSELRASSRYTTGREGFLYVRYTARTGTLPCGPLESIDLGIEFLAHTTAPKGLPVLLCTSVCTTRP
jgi:hypothetical protein